MRFDVLDRVRISEEFQKHFSKLARVTIDLPPMEAETALENEAFQRAAALAKELQD